MTSVTNPNGSPGLPKSADESPEMSLQNLSPEKTIERLEQQMYDALETYSNVHRGSGHFSMVTTRLYDRAREIVLEYLGLNKSKFTVIFCTSSRAKGIISQLEPRVYQLLSDSDLGLSLGVRALVVKKKVLPKGIPQQTGGGTARLMAKDWVVWAKAPARFEAGTPAIINVIGFCSALQLVMKFGKNTFSQPATAKNSAREIIHNDELIDYTGQELLDALRNKHIGRNVDVPTTEGKKTFINFDNSASTPTFEPIWEAFRQGWRFPEESRQELVSEVRLVCAKMFGAPESEYEFFFTSNTTEAINLAADNIGRERTGKTEPLILNTLLEHSSNDLPWRNIPDHSLITLSVDDKGFIDLTELEKTLNDYNKNHIYGNQWIKLVALSAASNVLGTCNNLADISRIVHKFGAELLVDAAQLIAHREVDMKSLDIDFLAFSAHKVYAPFGCGVLVARKNLLNFKPYELEQLQFSGEDNPGGIAALGKSLVLLQRIGMKVIRQKEKELTAQALYGLAKIPNLRIFGITDPESPHFEQRTGVIVFDLKGVIPTKTSRLLAQQGGIGTRSGCHCAHIIVKHLHNIGPGIERLQRLIVTLFPRIELPGLVRVSFGIENTVEEVEEFIRVMKKIAGKKPGSKGKAEIKPALQRFIEEKVSDVYPTR